MHEMGVPRSGGAVWPWQWQFSHPPPPACQPLGQSHFCLWLGGSLGSFSPPQQACRLKVTHCFRLSGQVQKLATFRGPQSRLSEAELFALLLVQVPR